MFLTSEHTIQEGFQRLETIIYEGPTTQGGRFLTHLGPLETTFYAPNIIRLRFLPKERVDYGMLAISPQEVEVNYSEISDGYSLQAGETSLEIYNNPLAISLKQNGKTVLESATDRDIQGNLRWMPFARRDKEWMVSLNLSSESSVYGLGEKFGSLNRKGQLVDSWNQDALTVNAERSYKNVPFAWSPAGWGLFVHTTSRVVHGVGYPQWSHRNYIIQVPDPQLDLFFIMGDTPADLLKTYTTLTGSPVKPPRWSYGVWMSRAYYQTAEEVIEVAQRLREEKIPSDMLVLDGRAWHKMETRFDFQWDHERYPNPEEFVQTLRDMDFRLCLWEYPYISIHNHLFNKLAKKGFLLKNKSGEPYVHRWLPWPFDSIYPHLMPSGIIDFTNPKACQWFRDAHKDLFEMGVSAMKTDYGESIPEDVVASNGESGEMLHNIYPLLYNKCVYESAQRYNKEGALVWGRSGWAGSQRYPIQWGGDPQSDWEGLAASIRGGLSWGMSGAPFYSHDIGGFAIGEPEPTLYIRWAQAGLLMSHARFHGLGRREPWCYGEEAQRIIKKWLVWRYRLIPYLQACALEAQNTGLPVMRAMPLAFPEERSVWCYQHQYLLGPSLLVIPVINPEGKASYYLPTGTWYNIWNEERVEGPAVFEDEEVPLDYIPIFGRAGTLLPLGPAVQHTGELESELDLQELWVFGKPECNLRMPGLTLEVNPGTGDIKGLPQDVSRRDWI